MNDNNILEEIKKWNWGAFLFNIFWGLGNKSYLPLLCLIPIFNLPWMFVCGFKGNEWAWKNGGFQDYDLENFKAIQSTWNRAGFITFISIIIGFILWVLIISTIIAELSLIFDYR